MGKVIRALPGDIVEHSVFGQAPWFTTEILYTTGGDVILIVRDKHGQEIARVIR